MNDSVAWELAPLNRRVRVLFGGQTLADSDGALRLIEHMHEPFDPAAVAMKDSLALYTEQADVFVDGRLIEKPAPMKEPAHLRVLGLERSPATSPTNSGHPPVDAPAPRRYSRPDDAPFPRAAHRHHGLGPL